MIKQDVLRT